MAVHSYDDLKAHISHKFECVAYANGVNVSLECLTCNTVIISYDKGESDFDGLEEEIRIQNLLRED